MSGRIARSIVLAVAVAAMLPVASTPARAGSLPTQDDDIDTFMHRVLERRLTNWEDLYRYTVRDRESFQVDGPDGATLGSYHGEYTWYVRDGFMIRSPDSIDGHGVSDQERERFEKQFLSRAIERDARRQERRQRRAEETGDESALEREFFLGFPYEPGNYLLAGRETLDDMNVLRVEYYPEKLFEDDGEEDPEDLEWARRFSKTSVVTLWILPELHQIVRVEYDNVGFDFLPLRWLVQVDDVGASMTLFKPFDDRDVWLPREIVAAGSATVADGSYDFEYRLEYHDYREAEVGARVRFRIPGVERRP